MERETLFDIFNIAIENEASAAAFYQNAAKNTSDTESRKIFEEFARMETQHLNRLKERYAELRETTPEI